MAPVPPASSLFCQDCSHSWSDEVRSPIPRMNAARISPATMRLPMRSARATRGSSSSTWTRISRPSSICSITRSNLSGSALPKSAASRPYQLILEASLPGFNRRNTSFFAWGFITTPRLNSGLRRMPKLSIMTIILAIMETSLGNCRWWVRRIASNSPTSG